MGDYIQHFREALRIKTYGEERALGEFQEFLVRTYPLFHGATERHVLGPYGVVYRWPGTAPAGERKPALILAHYDVVPAEEEKWSVPPFDAEIREGYVYGRGALDMKNVLICIMEGAEDLCRRKFRPRGDIWFAFGGDEERAGVQGAIEIARWFQSRGIRFEWILDEGGIIAEGLFQGLESPLALVGIEEKGFLSVELSVSQAPGHASKPPRTQGAAVLGRALYRLSRRRFPPQLSPVVEELFRGLAPLVPKSQGRILKHPRLFFPALALLADKLGPDIAVMFRTTLAMTQLEGSAADNVLPSRVRAVINLRLLSPWTVERAMDFVKKVIRDDRVEIKVHGLGTDPVPALPGQIRRTGPGWKTLMGVLGDVFPGVPALPCMMTATTDSRHYKELSEGGIFRFSPVRLTKRELALVHGHDERISLENLEQGLRFFTRLFEGL